MGGWLDRTVHESVDRWISSLLGWVNPWKDRPIAGWRWVDGWIGGLVGV